MLRCTFSLFSQLQQSEEAREAEMADLNEITDEFTERLSDAEQKINQVLRVRHFLPSFNHV